MRGGGRVANAKPVDTIKPRSSDKQQLLIIPNYGSNENLHLSDHFKVLLQTMGVHVAAIQTEWIPFKAQE